MHDIYVNHIIICPYCKYKNSVSDTVIIDRFYRVYTHLKGVMNCDLDSGGCDKFIAYTATIKISSEIYKTEKATE